MDQSYDTVDRRTSSGRRRLDRTAKFDAETAELIASLLEQNSLLPEQHKKDHEFLSEVKPFIQNLVEEKKLRDRDYRSITTNVFNAVIVAAGMVLLTALWEYLKIKLGPQR